MHKCSVTQIHLTLTVASVWITLASVWITVASVWITMAGGPGMSRDGPATNQGRHIFLFFGGTPEPSTHLSLWMAFSLVLWVPAAASTKNEAWDKSLRVWRKRFWEEGELNLNLAKASQEMLMLPVVLQVRTDRQNQPLPLDGVGGFT